LLSEYSELSLKIYLLSLDGGNFVFYSEGPEAVVELEAAIPRRGIRGWVERKYKSLQVILTESEKGVGLRMRRIWEWLQKRISPDEPILRALRGVRVITLHYPLTIGQEDTVTMWKRYLRERQGRHMFWFIANTLVSPLTLLLAPVPGPNLIGYWFVYRAVCHLLARLGARHARSERVETDLVSTGMLDAPLGTGDEKRIGSLSAAFGLVGLDAYIKRIKPKRKSRRRKAPVAVSYD
jgi:hypothetical protein